MHRLLAACALAVLAWPVTAARQDPEGSRGTVVIDAVAVDRSGKTVMDLKPAEVEVWIGHFRVPVETFTVVTPGADERAGRLFVLLLDDITTPLPMMSRVKDTARRFVAGMAPGDQMAIVMLNDPVLESTSDPAQLRRTIDAYSVRATGVMRSDRLGAHVLATLTTIARGFAEAGTGRKTIVGIGSGWLLDKPLPPPQAGHDLLPEWIAAMRGLSRTNSAFYVIDPGGVGTSRMADGGEAGFARETGGMAFLNTNDLNGTADRIMRESASYYALRVGSPPVGANGLRELELRVSRRGVTLRARRAIH